MTLRETLTILAWALLLGLALALPGATHSPTLADDLTRYTARVALLFWFAASVVMLVLEPAEWAAVGRGRLARCCWSLAWLGYVIHLGVAFHYYHHWSHAAAVRHVQEASGFGEGIFVSHAFTLFWTLDMVAWWLRPSRYAARSPWFDRLLHGFMAFMVFNASVVYEQGFIRWAGLTAFAVLAPLWLATRRFARLTPDLREEPS
jgi:hypothetical protein